MKQKILLRIAAALMLLHTAGHTIGALTWTHAPDTSMQQVIHSMQYNRFDFMGRSCSIGDFYSGYGYSMIGVLLVIAIILWLLSMEAHTQILITIGLFLIFLAIIECIYFFPMAAAFSLLAGIATLTAYRRPSLK